LTHQIAKGKLREIKTYRSQKKEPVDRDKKIAGLLGMSRNTVKAALEKESPLEYRRKDIIIPKLSPYKGYIVDRIVLKRLKGS